MTTLTRTDTSLISRWWWTVDRWSLGAIGIMILIGAVLTMAASPAVAERIGLDTFHFARRQFAYIPLAVMAMLIASLLAPIGVKRLALLVFGGALILTTATLFVGAEVKGATRWLSVGGLSLQPSEFLKPSFAVVSAWLISVNRLDPRFPGYIVATALLGVCVFVLLQQPDVGVTLMVTGVYFVQLFLIGLPFIVVGLLAGLFAGGAVGAYFMYSHVRQRVDNFFDPSSGEGYQVNRALEAFQAGGLFGRGPGEGRVKQVLPDAHSDFILAVAGEEFGVLLCLLVVALFAFVVLRGFSRTLKDENLFVVLAGSGLLAQFGMQALINMASSVHIIPPKGITLPFISYGGSSTIALAWAIGIVLALTRERPSPRRQS
ncbi:MAG: FtsW/RodA/SpoVE family cell cycle protein [Caulobacteraceae bacterium]